MPGNKSQVIGGSVLTLLLVGLALRTLLVGVDNAQRQKERDAEMKRHIDREVHLLQRQFSTGNLRATSQRSDEPPQGEAEGEKEIETGGKPEAAPASHP